MVALGKSLINLLQDLEILKKKRVVAMDVLVALPPYY